jgi:hypothetical protein
VANRQPHDPGTKAQARQVYEAHGPEQASRVSGVPARTIYRWAVAEQWGLPPEAGLRHAADQGVADAAPGPGRAAAAGKSAATAWQPARVLGRLAAEVDATLDDLAALRAGRRYRDARDVAVQVGILVDKAVALAKQTGTSGGRLDPAASVARIHELLDGIEGRRRARAQADGPG